MMIFRCNEDWFAMINPIKPNIWACEHCRNRRQKVFKSFKILPVESYLLYMSIKRTWTLNSAQNWGAKQGASQKSGGLWPTQALP